MGGPNILHLIFSSCLSFSELQMKTDALGLHNQRAFFKKTKHNRTQSNSNQQTRKRYWQNLKLRCFLALEVATLEPMPFTCSGKGETHLVVSGKKAI